MNFVRNLWWRSLELGGFLITSLRYFPARESLFLFVVNDSRDRAVGYACTRAKHVTSQSAVYKRAIFILWFWLLTGHLTGTLKTSLFSLLGLVYSDAGENVLIPKPRTAFFFFLIAAKWHIASLNVYRTCRKRISERRYNCHFCFIICEVGYERG